MPAFPPLLPFPQHVIHHAGHVLLPSHGMIILSNRLDRLPENERHPLLFWANQLREDLAAAGAPGWQVCSFNGSRAVGHNGIQLPDSNDDVSDVGDRASIVLRLDASLPQHGSHLTIQPHAPSCLLAAQDLGSLRDGIQTLRQLLRGSGLALPCCELSDRPALTVRGFSLDISRGRIPSIATIHDFLDVLELLKFNQLQFYVEAAVAFPQTIEAWRSSSPLTFDDIRKIDTLCQERGIEFVPSLASFGHMYDILRTPRWRSLGEHPKEADRPFSFVERMRHHTLNPADPRALEFSERQIDDYAPLFGSHLFNIGGDETFDLGTGASASVAKKVGIPHLYADFVGKLCAHLVHEGRTPIMYTDIALKYPQLLPALDKKIIFANWDYAAKPNCGNVRKVAESGHRQFVCPGVETWNRLLPNTDAAWSNISSLCQAGNENNADGMLVTDWGDYGHVNDLVMSLPGLAFAAECAWRSTPRPRQAVEQAASRLLFHDATGTLVSLIGKAARQQKFGWNDAVLWWELDAGNSRANPDVIATLGLPDTLERDLSAARARFVETRCPTQKEVGFANERLHELLGTVSRLSVSGLQAVSGTRAGSGSSLLPSAAPHPSRLLDSIPTLVLAIRGQMLLNDLGLAVQGSMKSARLQALSRDLNNWSLDFEHSWLAVSRRSRIDDVLHILWGYADKLLMP